MAALIGAGGAVFAAGLALHTDSAQSGSPAAKLLPDLEVERPRELYLDENRKTTRLRVSNTVSNKGIGPLEIEGDGSPCDYGDGLGRRTVQRVFLDDPSHSESVGHFIRGQDEASMPTQAGCSRYHPAHDHWHFDNFARYTLYRERTGKVVGKSRKVSFCVIDTGRPYPGLPGSPNESYYPQDPENPQLPTCSESSVDGLSIGWEDTYGASLPGQAIKVTGQPKGRYCLKIEADPPTDSKPDGLLAETDATNNTRTLRFRMLARKGVVRRLGSACRSPV